MTTIKTAGSTALGDDYDTIAEVLADIPADLTATSGDWIVEFRGGFDFDGFTIPLIVTDATHQLIFRAIAGDEVDGTGTGAGFQGTVGGSITFIQTITGQQNDTHLQIIGLKIHAESGYGGDTLNLDDVNNKVIKDCFITSKSGNGFTTSNAAVCIATLENVIIADCSGNGTNYNNASVNASLTFNRVTCVNNGGVGFDDRGFGNAGFINSFRNLLSFGNAGNDFNSRLSDSNVDYFAGGDGTQSEAPINFTATSADFANYAGGDYSLATGSSLRGAGESGEDIGATLPAAAPAAVISVTGATASYAYTAQNGAVGLTGTIEITGSAASYSYSAVNGVVDLTGSIDVTGSTANYSYNAVNGAVSLTPTATITITGSTASYSYLPVNAAVELTPDIVITGQTASYSYQTVSANVSLQGTITVTGNTASYSYSAGNALVSLNPFTPVVEFSGIIKKVTFSGILLKSEFSGTIKQLEFSGTRKAASFSGVRK